MNLDNCDSKLCPIADTFILHVSGNFVCIHNPDDRSFTPKSIWKN